MEGSLLAGKSVQAPSASSTQRDLNLGVLAASGDRPLVHDRSTSSDQEYIGEVDRSADMVRCDPNERPQL